MTEADWVTAAMADNDVVAEVLLRLRLPTLPPSSKRRRPAPLQSWTIHQRRSRTQPILPASTKSETPRASPSTPLSWSGATSVSGGGAGAPIADALDSTQPNHNCSDISRSKVIRPPGETTPTKRPRKKKTLAALKEEGIVLMEEQNDLKKKLAALQANCEKQRKENERLKKIKLEIQVELQSERPKTMRNNYSEVVNERNDKTVLPDLNVPFGEDVILSY
ncbi:hypothetical protein L1987_66975 [Smallanthus sonchifolius]|uniref:Uncharacterized protein n=1 Tax=Smallanthus sonchifolius TaxID=185202 RepID=A0ACB9BYV6_9ASTR|nr:hypothetical protein L1987_66975 [Smallanthus sonchifolius]